MATSKEVRVRVDGFSKISASVFPGNVGRTRLWRRAALSSAARLRIAGRRSAISEMERRSLEAAMSYRPLRSEGGAISLGSGPVGERR